jgi:hypothetical protein
LPVDDDDDDDDDEDEDLSSPLSLLPPAMAAMTISATKPIAPHFRNFFTYSSLAGNRGRMVRPYLPAARAMTAHGF